MSLNNTDKCYTQGHVSYCYKKIHFPKYPRDQSLKALQLPWADCLDAYANFFPNHSPAFYSYREVILYLHVDEKVDYYSLTHGYRASVPQFQTTMDVPLEWHVQVNLNLMYM
jgi:hypothetical protein